MRIMNIGLAFETVALMRIIELCDEEKNLSPYGKEGEIAFLKEFRSTGGVDITCADGTEHMNGPFRGFKPLNPWKMQLHPNGEQ